MSPFFWRTMAVFSLLFLIFTVATITVTLLLVDEVRNSIPNNAKLTYVQVANWIYVGFLGLGLMAALLGTPYIMRYTRRSESIVGTGLKPVSESRKQEKEREKGSAAYTTHTSLRATLHDFM